MKRTSFEKDSTGEYAELFLHVRDFIKICIDNDAKEKYSKTLRPCTQKRVDFATYESKMTISTLVGFEADI